VKSERHRWTPVARATDGIGSGSEFAAVGPDMAVDLLLDEVGAVIGPLLEPENASG
jgi:hypothetical protein